MRSHLPRWLIEVLRDNGIRRMSRLAAMSDAEILALDGVGRRSLELIHAELSRLRSVAPGDPSSPASAHL
ncbi:helix-hairpin-helix domain-containing protein [Rhizobium oryzicola]|uniref:Helix-hairpin-helix domain-containing protein n=1 Tax=Rhizobium oryzicola TaxID=1232668 RepID=A0ABT8SSS8_9HYPH|nr:helix-hairpin-helix domain-containing protein [Rhizobium oryzicola]MDO1581484.1 helix-hairpin-helix domain-containing protein [Rhizobium oryzicola]